MGLLASINNAYQEHNVLVDLYHKELVTKEEIIASANELSVANTSAANIAQVYGVMHDLQLINDATLLETVECLAGQIGPLALFYTYSSLHDKKILSDAEFLAKVR